MTWRDYWTRAIEDIDDAHERTDRTWQVALAVIIAWELWLRRRTVDRTFRLPVVAGGWLDLSDRSARRRYHSETRLDTLAAFDGLRHQLGGPHNPLSPPGAPTSPIIPASPRGAPRTPPGGVVPAAIRETVRGARTAAEDLERMFEAAMAEAAARNIPVPEERDAEAPRQARSREERESEDFGEVTDDALINIVRNLATDLDRVTEELIRLVSRNNPPEAVKEFMDGTVTGGPSRSSDGQPWQINRNNIRLSTTAHIRAAHRRRMVSEGIAAGVENFRLDVPTAVLPMVTPTSTTGQYVWQIRPYGEWQAIAGAKNRSRIRASGFDTLGLGFGDMTYVVPVPAIFLSDAKKQSSKWRRRLLEGAIVTALAKEAA